MVLRCAEVLPQFLTYFLLMTVYCSKELIWKKAGHSREFLKSMVKLWDNKFIFPNLLSSSVETLTVARKTILRSY